MIYHSRRQITMNISMEMNNKFICILFPNFIFPILMHLVKIIGAPFFLRGAVNMDIVGVSDYYGEKKSSCGDVAHILKNQIVDEEEGQQYGPLDTTIKIFKEFWKTRKDKIIRSGEMRLQNSSLWDLIRLFHETSESTNIYIIRRRLTNGNN